MPEPLRGLSTEVLEALRVLQIDVGPGERAMPTAWRPATAKHGKMLRLSWRPEQPRRRSRRTSACRFLKGSEDSTCACYLQEHKHAAAAAHAHIEETGVENAVWPDLHWTTDTCETCAPESDVRRLARLAKAKGKRADGPQTADQPQKVRVLSRISKGSFIKDSSLRF